jgi:sulfate transport system ATP-binding protein
MDISLRRIAKTFGLSPALNGVDLDIRSGELLGLLGPSGSGKTTLLRIIAGLEQPSDGEVYFGDENALERTVQERRVGFVFQHYALFKHMRVADNIAYGLRVRPRSERPTPAAIRARVDELLALIQLDGLADRFPAQLSGGQRQRVALARALAVEPKVLLLDEPFGALDAKVRKDLRRWLREIHLKTGHTTVFVTHDQDEAMELSDRVAILNRGRIEQLGSPDEIHDAPANAFVFDFLGDAVALPARIEGGVMSVSGKSLPGSASVPTTGTGTLYVRAQDWRVAGRDVGLPATIVAMRRSRLDWRAEMRGASGMIFDVMLPQDTRLKTGDTIGLLPTAWTLILEDGRLVRHRASPATTPTLAVV